MTRNQRWLYSVLGPLLVLVLFFLLFDWNWLRHPTERALSDRLQRAVQLGHMDIHLGRQLVLRLRDVRIANAPWANAVVDGEPADLAYAHQVEVALAPSSVLSLWFSKGPLVLPYLRLTNAQLRLHRLADGRANWDLAGVSTKSPKEPGAAKVELRALRIDQGELWFEDEKLRVSAQVQAQTVNDARYPTRVDFSGSWRGAKFDGQAQAGSVLGLHHSEQPFALKLQLNAGSTRIRAEGEITDLARLERIDTDFSISGPSLASLYPTLKIVLPATPPYELHGRLKKEGNTYAYGDFKGQIGGSDISGDGEFVLREPRPFLKATLRSKRLQLADLGPLVGVGDNTAKVTKAVTTESVTTQALTTKKAASATAKTTSKPTRTTTTANTTTERVLPNVELDALRLQAIDAQVNFEIQTLQLPQQLSFHRVRLELALANGDLKIDPLHFAFVGGEVAGRLRLNGTDQPLTLTTQLELRQLRLAQLLAPIKQLKATGGVVGAQLNLQGQGGTVGQILAHANGQMTLGAAGGQISHLALAAASLNGGRILQLLLEGDKPTSIRCLGIAVIFKQGLGQIAQFVFDTGKVRVDGEGSVNLRQERLNLLLKPQPKQPSLFSARAPIRVQGSFTDVNVDVGNQAWARGGAAVVLGLINPLAALIPLIETGQGEDSDCRQVLAPVKEAMQ